MTDYHSIGGVIYFLNAEGTDLWKVGFCRSESGVKNRISELQTGCPFKLNLISVKKHATQKYEGFIHCLMKRHRLVGEWFNHNSWIDDFMDGWRII